MFSKLKVWEWLVLLRKANSSKSFKKLLQNSIVFLKFHNLMYNLTFLGINVTTTSISKVQCYFVEL